MPGAVARNDVVRDWRRWSYRERIGAMLLIVAMIAALVSAVAFKLA
jgi:hypothetical protein